MKEQLAHGAVDSPYLFVMMYAMSEGMEGWFWKKLQAAGIKKKDVRIVYMLDEVPAGSSGPLKSQIRSARDRFEREMKASTPEVVLPMGGEAFHALTGIEEKIFDARGYLIRSNLFRPVPTEVWKQIGVYKNASKASGAKKGDPKMKWVTEAAEPLLGMGFKGTVIPLFTLDHIRTEQFALTPAFKEDLMRASRVVTSTLREIDKDMVYYTTFNSFIKGGKKHVVKAKSKTLQGIKWGKIIAVDIETHGVDNEVIDLVSFSDGVVTASLEWSELVCDFMTYLFALPNRLYAVHNSPFDIPRLIRNGVIISQKVIDRQIYDTMFAAVTLQPDLHKGLGRISTVFLDISPWKWRSLIDADPRFYSAKDAFVTAWLCMQEYAVMENMKLLPLFLGTDNYPGPGVMETIPELTLMSEGGIRTNKKYAEVWCARLEKHMRLYFKLWYKMFPEVKVTSNPQLIKLFHEEWGLPVNRTSKDGVSVDELSLVKLGAFVEMNRESELFPGKWKTDYRCNQRTFDLILKIRERGKILSTYVQPLLLDEVLWVHPQYMPVSKDDERGGMNMSSKGNTATGRLVAYRPNIQNQPKKTRALYVPDTDNMCFIQADYKSAELYVLAGMSGDKRLMDDLKFDLHQRNADRLGVARKSAKNVTYASQYLASPAKQSEMILEQEHIYISPAECQVIANGIWGYYSDATAYKNYLIALCETKRYITNPFGRVRFFHSGAATAAVNFIPQSTVADILWCVLKPIAELARQYGGRLVTTVHDSILVCVPQQHRNVVAIKMREIMERRFDCVAPGFYIPVDLEVGEPGAAWSTLTKYVEAA